MLPTSSVRPVGSGAGLQARVNYFVLATVVWCIASLGVLVGGIWHCRANAYSYDIKCDAKSTTPQYCLFSSTLSSTATRRIQRTDITDVRLVRLDKAGEIVDTNGMRHRQLNRLGSTLQFTYKVRPGQVVTSADPGDHAADHSEHDYETLDGRPDHIKTEAFLFPPIDMGGNMRPAKSGRRKLEEYITHHSDGKPVSVTNGKAVTVMGLLCILVGIFSTILSCMMGTVSALTASGSFCLHTFH